MLEFFKKNIKTPRGVGFLFLIYFSVVLLEFVFSYKIEVVAPGRGITVMKGSDVVIKSPESAYVKELFVSQTEFVDKGAPLLTYRNLDDEYLLEKTRQSLVKDLQRKKSMEEEICFLYSSVFIDGASDYTTPFDNCSGEYLKLGEGGQYVYQFYDDYQQEKEFF